eukprot:TRINITY_DN3109_c0_g1_i2.p1 TRINITY_DN3109_c0_g1~~TRINITY_DN3109_c0_g1_i2.p1  ORF type:complete len:509 (-),score=176.69 TRINITY_DN3109_c0_g1_i2:179-1705(-)
MDTDPKMLPNQVIPDKTLDEDNVMETTDNGLISNQLVQDTNSQDILNHNLENEQLNIVRNNKNDIQSTEDLNDINQETAVVTTDTANSSNSCGAGGMTIVTSEELDENVENTIVGENEVVNTSTEIVKEAEKDKSEQSVSQTPSPTEGVEEPSIYCIKWVEYNQSRCGIITQSSNGPCPLLAIVNVLLLRGKLALPEGCQVISAEQLLEYLADLLISLTPDSQNSLPDFQHNMNDAIAILPKLQTGLDVNVKFTGVRDFEYTPECIIFDLLNISLYHGWLVDPQLEDTVLAVAGLSYNQLVETIITNSEAEDSTKVSQSLIAQQFLEESASQLTYHGLCELNTVMKEGQLAVFFRNNHFSTVYKQGANLYLLVTDQGFLHQLDVVWETLENIEGDTVFVDHQLNPVQPDAEAGASGGSPDQDHLLAMSLQKEDEAQRDKDREWQNFKEKHLGNTEGLTDSELAARLQEAENAAAEEERQEGESAGGHGEAQGQAIGPRSNRDKKCVIL